MNRVLIEGSQPLPLFHHGAMAKFDAQRSASAEHFFPEKQIVRPYEVGEDVDDAEEAWAREA